jgi:hypothetical protein
MIRAVVALALVAVALALDGGPARAFVGDVCRHLADCSGYGPAFCLADGPTSSTGRCVAGRVLP